MNKVSILTLKAEAYQRGFYIGESLTKNGGIMVYISKRDTDDLELYANLELSIDDYIGAVLYGETIRKYAFNIEERINNRHAQNINNCMHEITNVGNKKVCIHCMGKFGTQMSIDLMDN
ncbi:MAG: hypothetical protein ACK53T_02265 [Planctomycetota bacterium]|jgi:hypothetical protein